MEAFAGYLLKSSLWLTGFALVYFLFLRNERFFLLKRYYLLAGIFVSCIFPLISIHYKVDVSSPVISPVEFTQASGTDTTSIGMQSAGPVRDFAYLYLLLVIYITGVILLIFRITRQIIRIYSTIRKSDIASEEHIRLIRTPVFTSSFTFFNLVFIHNSINETEKREILNHEFVHVRQRHWFDLLIMELLCFIQWMNPFVWLYSGFIKTNHEYIADEYALQMTSNPAVYRAVLMNQIFGIPVIRLSNSFNHSINRLRFEMMKEIHISSYRKLKLLIVIPVCAILLLAFAKPEYYYVNSDNNYVSSVQEHAIQQNIVKGVVLNEDGNPLRLVTIITPTGTGMQTGSDGRFLISNIEKDASLRFSCIGYRNKSVKADFSKNMVVRMFIDPEYSSTVMTMDWIAVHEGPYVTFRINGDDKRQSLVTIDGKETPVRGSVKLKRDDIGDIKALKGEEAINKYGEKGEFGVIEILSKEKADELGIKPPEPKPRRMFPDDYPTFMGESHENFTTWLLHNVEYPKEAIHQKIEGRVSISFAVENDGSLSNIRLIGTPNLLLGSAVLKTVRSSPKWEPPKNPVFTEPYIMGVTIRFSLPDRIMRDETYVMVEEMPSYPGGDEALMKFIYDNIQYPAEAKADSIQGRVILRFVINKEGNVEDIDVLKGVNPLLDAEAVRVISILSGWRPGHQGGKPVDVYYSVPVTFSLK